MPVGPSAVAPKIGKVRALQTVTPAGATEAPPRGAAWTPRAAGPRATVGADAAAAEVDAAARAKAFSEARTPEAFAAWAEASPAPAALWLRSVASVARNSEALASLDAVLQSPRAKAAELPALFAAVHATGLTGPQPMTGMTNPTDGGPKQNDPPPLTGKLTLENGQPILSTAMGRFTISNQPAADVQHVLSGVDVQAFAGRTVTVRGWPEAGGRPGENVPGALAVQEFAPGTSADFSAGRVRISGDDVLVRVRPDKELKVTDPKLAAQLRAFDALGVVLPGAARREGDGWVYDAAPKDFYILAGFSNAYDPKRKGDTVEFALQLAHGKSVPCKLPTEAWDNTARQSRHYFYGHFENGEFKAGALTPSAGGFNPGGVGGQASMAFVERAVPVQREIFSAQEASFEPR